MAEAGVPVRRPLGLAGWAELAALEGDYRLIKGNGLVQRVLQQRQCNATAGRAVGKLILKIPAAALGRRHLTKTP